MPVIFPKRLSNDEFSIDKESLRWLLQTARKAIQKDIISLGDSGSVAALEELIKGIDHADLRLGSYED